MEPLTDPLVWAAVIGGAVLVFRSCQCLARDIAMRRKGSSVGDPKVRSILSDYRVRYGPREGYIRLQEDLKGTRLRVEALAAKWKECQGLREQALREAERRRLAEEERKIYEALISEAQRLRVLKEAQQHMRH